MGRRFVWRIAGFIAAAFLLIAVMLTIGVVLAGTAVGLIAAPHGVRFLAIAALLVLVIVILRGSRRFQRMAVNLGEIVDAAGRIEAGDYGVQVAERGPRELQTLARAFNAMSTRLATADRNRRTFVADLTHELRTPLAIIRGQAEGIGDGVYPAIDADPARIRGVLGNLLSNAIRYSPSGGTVTASARRLGETVAFGIRDTGPGIPSELRPRIFDRFVKGPGSPGSGLGLAIAKDVVTAHGGTIEAISDPGKGTEIRFTLPVAR